MDRREDSCRDIAVHAGETAPTVVAPLRSQPFNGQAPEPVGHSEQAGFAGLTSHILEPESGLDPHSPLVDEAYRCWRAVWEPTFFELTGLMKLHSDDFARQHELVTVFQEERCVGLTGFRYIDLDADVTRHDSYFGELASRGVCRGARLGPRGVHHRQLHGDARAPRPPWRPLVERDRDRTFAAPPCHLSRKRRTRDDAQ